MDLSVLKEIINRLLYVQGDSDEALELKRTFFTFAYLLVIPPVICLTILTYILAVPVLQLYGWLLLSYYLLTLCLFLWLKKYVFTFYYMNALVVMSITFFIVLKQGGLMHTGGILYSLLAIIIFSFVFEKLMMAIVTSVYYVIGIGVISIMQPWLTPAPEMLRGNINLIFTTINSLWISVLIFMIIYYVFEKRTKESKIKNELILKSMNHLKATQSQLIQSEKMAALGELTAGIAHEIQNPLNLVNNFSEVSSELVTELNTEIEKDNTKVVKEIASDLKQNLEKINHHGKRAADIVKGMLQHSRTSSGQKELTDINALADEYLRLAYHGLRAKDKSFNAKFETHLDPTLPKLNVIPQDIGRVLLNLINNAFYAVSEKSKVESQKSGSSYEPTVTVSTKNLGDKIEISVQDNGNGVPDSIKDKIFQPFFTTKPTGQGTGLGLSLSYDIVKAHGGELKVDSKAGIGTEFTISLSL